MWRACASSSKYRSQSVGADASGGRGLRFRFPFLRLLHLLGHPGDEGGAGEGQAGPVVGQVVGEAVVAEVLAVVPRVGVPVGVHGGVVVGTGED